MEAIISTEKMTEKRAGARNLEAEFGDFCSGVHEKLVRALSLYCGDIDVAEEMAQEALAVAWRDWAKLKNVESPEGYVVKTGLNLCNSSFRRKAAERRAEKRLRRSLSQSHSTEETVPPQSVMVRELLAALPRRQRTALVLRFFLDLSVASTAELMDISEGTVKALTSHATSNLRNKLATERSDR